jgi:crossover junction endodeoxyribonuclease RuvC
MPSKKISKKVADLLQRKRMPLNSMKYLMTSSQHKDKEIILGIDPGTQVTGYGIIKHLGHGQELIDFGCIRTKKINDAPKRYLAIFEGIESLIKTHQPNAIAVETQFVYKNIQSAMKLGMARGVVLLAAARANIPIFEYAPRKAKLAVVGNGGASKEQVQKMIQLLFKLSSLPQPEDASDALALALCHAHASRLKHLLKVST